jgi:hypothetical protein
MARRLLIAAAVMALSLFVISTAQADTGDVIEPQHEPPTAADGFQAATCYENQEEENPAKPFCSPETPDLFFTQAGGHPPVGFDQYIVRHETVVPGVIEPLVEDPSDPLPFEDRVLKTERVDLPPGFTVSPEAAPKCSQEDFEALGQIPGQPPGTIGRVPACPDDTIVGRDEVWLVVNTANAVPAPPPAPPGTFLPKGFVIKPDPARGTLVDVYNLEPKPGEPARLGFVIAFSRVIELETEVAWEGDFHESFAIHLPPPSIPFSTLKSRLLAYGQTGDGTHVTLPTTCFDPNEWSNLYSTWFRGDSAGEPNPTFPHGSTPWEAKLPPGAATTGCDKVPFDLSVEVDPGTNAVDSPSPATVTTKLPFDPAREGGEVRVNGEGETEGVSQSHVRKGEVTLPKGMGLNPSGAQGLVACTDEAFGKGERNYNNACPDESIIGTAEVDSAPLAEPLKGNVYVGTQKSRDPQSGEEFRILIEAKNENEGIVARLIGQVKADPTTGQLTAVLNDKLVGEFAGNLPEGLPQVPFESVKISFDESKAVLTSPPTCAEQTTDTEMEPWARPGTFVSPSAKFTLSSVPGGGTCPQTLAERRFTPAYTAKSDSTKAGAYSPFRVNIGRVDGEQELKVVDVTLPKGLTGKLAGIPYCSEEALSAAAAGTGKAEQASSSCSADSMIGTVATESGTGSNPLKLSGKAYLAGPYKGAPLSMATITPAVAGPFDLGNVVVRVALNVDPSTAQVNAVSDQIPDVFGGVKLDIRSIDVNVDRSKFMLNPTNCAAQATSGTINGGGGDPANPAEFSSYGVSAPFQASECSKLGFKPKLFTRLFGPTQRAKNPRIRAILEARNGDANITRTALTLPHSLFLDQSHIRTVCTRVQLAAKACPKGAVYGQAEAKSPLLDKKLKGPVYLVSSNDQLPNLVADLRGQVNIQLRGVISSKRGGLKTVFPTVPDVPVKKFILNMKGGDKSLLVNSTNTCKDRQLAYLNIKGQNNKKVTSKKYRLNVSSCGKKKGKK